MGVSLSENNIYKESAYFLGLIPNVENIKLFILDLTFEQRFYLEAAFASRLFFNEDGKYYFLFVRSFRLDLFDREKQLLGP